MTRKTKQTASAVGIGLMIGVVLMVLTDESWWVAVGLAIGSGIGMARK